MPLQSLLKARIVESMPIVTDIGNGSIQQGNLDLSPVLKSLVKRKIASHH